MLEAMVHGLISIAESKAGILPVFLWHLSDFVHAFSIMLSIKNILGFSFLATTLVFAAPKTEDRMDRQPTPEELMHLPAVVPEKVATLLKDVQAPADFNVTLFATPPAVNYPVFIAAAPDGTLYVSSDGNVSAVDQRSLSVTALSLSITAPIMSVLMWPWPGK